MGITEFGDTDALDDSGTVSIPSGERLRLAEHRAAGVRAAATSAARAIQAQLVDGGGAASCRPGFVAQTGDEFRADQRVEAGAFGR